MAKKPVIKTEPTDFEKELTKLVDKLAPGKLVMSRSRKLKTRPDMFDVVIETRDSKISFMVDTLQEGVDNVADALASGDEDPIVPAWHRCSRYQREVVIRTLQETASKHMAAAAAARLAGTERSRVEYQLADGFSAAVSALEIIETDGDGSFIPEEEKLEAPPMKVTQPRTPAKPRSAE